MLVKVVVEVLVSSTKLLVPVYMDLSSEKTKATFVGNIGFIYIYNII